jgi:hypothetical protein
MFSLVLRRVHMYLALFLSPWVVIYAVSTIAMNHKGHGARPPGFEAIEERAYGRTFAASTPPAEMARTILSDIGLDGAHTVGKPAADGSLAIQRLDPVNPKRVIFRPAEGKLKIEAQPFGAVPFLERMHRRRGYQQPYFADRVWAVSVDTVILAVLFWAASGLWMWWEMRATRRWGAAFLAGGIALFAFFLAAI